MPATVFAVAGQIGQEFWWEKIAWIIYSASELPCDLFLTTGGWTYHRKLRGDDKQEAKRALVIDLYRRLRPLSIEYKRELITQLGDWAEVQVNTQPSVRMLCSDELIELASSELIEIGSHSLTHPTMTAIPVESVHTEVQVSKALLEDVIGKTVTKFSYPDGATSRTVQAEVMSAEYTSACSSQYDVASRFSNPFCLPRIWPLDWGGEEFARWIKRWVND
jgi:peptidoglycan/xylan/chitin deacetylase (PgdA/CDA1 family)